MSERKILEKLIADGKDAERKLEKLKVTYSIGDRFKKDGTKYLLSSTEDYRVAMIALGTGGRFRGSTRVEDVTEITAKELEEIKGGWGFTRYYDARKEQMV